MSSGNQARVGQAAQPAGFAPRPPWACTVSVRVGSLSGQRKLSWERVGRTIELPRDVDSEQWFELCVNPEEQMAGKL